MFRLYWLDEDDPITGLKVEGKATVIISLQYSIALSFLLVDKLKGCSEGACQETSDRKLLFLNKVEPAPPPQQALQDDIQPVIVFV